MSLSLYAQYLKERCDTELVENGIGFATYRYLPNEFVYLVDIYVMPEHRKSKVASHLADRVSAEAYQKGKRYLLGSVDTRVNGVEISMKVLQGYGMRLHKVEGNMIYYIKDIVASSQIQELKDCEVVNG